MIKLKDLALAGSMSLSVLLAGCGGDESGSVTVPVVTTPTPTPTPTPAPTPTNTAPVANPGPNQNVLTKTSVTLDASASVDANGDTLTYKWAFKSRPSGSAATLSSATDAKPTFMADVAGTYVVTLIVNDGKVDSAPVDVTITATVANAAPVANAGPDQNVKNGTLVTLDGSGSSDANGDALTYQWTMDARPSGSTATLSSATAAKPTFVPDVAGNYILSLIVSDGSLKSVADSVTITSSRANAAPVANAGKDQNVPTRSTVTLDGRGSSDADGDTLKYDWNLTSKPAGSTASLSTNTQSVTNFTADVAGTYVATLVVNDGTVNSAPATVAITAVAPSLMLYRIDEFTGQQELLKLPYTTSASLSKSQSCVGNGCPTTVTIDKFRFSATGGSFTIQNVTAVNLTTGSNVAASFAGLNNGTVVSNGQAVSFSLQSDFTRGQSVNLRYEFTVKETGDKFSYTVELKTN
ncbi:PKD domain-containing protein [Sphingomonas sp.]|uniref:PKD domain-containing protein n=1 Tax=Sphingomonas sp. TaxID=28214 RepID=UPI0028A04850|nr:PKD domain-containing protein [Sphingomonas sp.]